MQACRITQALATCPHTRIRLQPTPMAYACRQSVLNVAQLYGPQRPKRQAISYMHYGYASSNVNVMRSFSNGFLS